MAKQPIKKEFTAEVSRLLQILTHSIYSNKEIFLRELISNASDACDKLRYLAAKQSDLKTEELKINIKIDEKDKSITISDNGIGMTSKELEENLGTIAKSGTKSFIESLSEDKSSTMQIGQFGIGFYSAFIVSNNVKVISRKYDSEEANLWTSDGTGSYSIEKYSNKHPVGTSIMIEINEESKDFLEYANLKSIVTKYSDNINFPIFITGRDSSPDEQINSASAIWMKAKNDVTEQQYNEHYNLISHNFDKPLSTIHYKAEGRYEYNVLLYIPSARPFDLFDQQRKAKLKLYVKRVLISEDTEVIPAYFRFVTGVIDCADIPLTVSREVLQENHILLSIKNAVKNRIISTLTKMAKDENETYETLWKTFGAVIKEGIYEDFEKKSDLLKLFRFNSTKSDKELRSLDQYIKDLKEGQKSIYYMTADDFESGCANPILEGFKARDIEVIILTDPVDSFWTTSQNLYENYELKHVAHAKDEIADLEIIDKSHKKNKKKDNNSNLSDLLPLITKILVDSVSEVRSNVSLVESPACIAIADNGYDKTMQKILNERQGFQVSKPVLEINPNHPIFELIQKKVKSNKSKEVETLVRVLLDYALIMDGEKPHNIKTFGKDILELLNSVN